MPIIRKCKQNKIHDACNVYNTKANRLENLFLISEILLTLNDYSLFITVILLK